MVNRVIAQSLIGYVETLYNLNTNLIKLCGADVFDEVNNSLENDEKRILDVIADIPRLIPYKCNKISEELELSTTDGLMEFKENLFFLEARYKSILKKHIKALDKIREIRNKYEHKMHAIKLSSAGSGSNVLFDVTFKIGDNYINIGTSELIDLTKDLNDLFDEILLLVEDYAFRERRSEHLYYKRLLRICFKDINEIYRSGLVKIIGKISRPF